MKVVASKMSGDGTSFSSRKRQFEAEVRRAVLLFTSIQVTLKLNLIFNSDTTLLPIFNYIAKW